MATLTLKVRVTGWTGDELRKAVADLDEYFSGKGNGILPGMVDASDILGCMLCGDLGVTSEVLEDRIEED